MEFDESILFENDSNVQHYGLNFGNIVGITLVLVHFFIYNPKIMQGVGGGEVFRQITLGQPSALPWRLAACWVDYPDAFATPFVTSA